MVRWWWEAEAQLGWTCPGDTGRSLPLPPFRGGAQAGRWRSQGGQGGRKEWNVSAPKAAGCRPLLSPSLSALPSPPPATTKQPQYVPSLGRSKEWRPGWGVEGPGLPLPQPLSKAQPCPNHCALITNSGSTVCWYPSCNGQACMCARSQPPCSCTQAVHPSRAFIHSFTQQRIHGPLFWVGWRFNASC